MAHPTRVRDAFASAEAANYSPFTQETVKVGEALEAIGYRLEEDGDHYSQGTQTLLYRRGPFQVSVSIEEAD